MRSLICAFVVRIWQKQVFPWSGSFQNCDHLAWGRESAGLYASCACVCLSCTIGSMLVFFFLLVLQRVGGGGGCDCGTPWPLPVPVFNVSEPEAGVTSAVSTEWILVNTGSRVRVPAQPHNFVKLIKKSILQTSPPPHFCCFKTGSCQLMAKLGH